MVIVALMRRSVVEPNLAEGQVTHKTLRSLAELLVWPGVMFDACRANYATSFVIFAVLVEILPHCPFGVCHCSSREPYTRLRTLRACSCLRASTPTNGSFLNPRTLLSSAVNHAVYITLCATFRRCLQSKLPSGMLSLLK